MAEDGARRRLPRGGRARAGDRLLPAPPVLGAAGDLRYQVNREDPARCRWPELKSRISTGGYDPGAA